MGMKNKENIQEKLYKLLLIKEDIINLILENMDAIKKNICPEKRLQIGATIGAHIGPEAFGIIFVEQSL